MTTTRDLLAGAETERTEASIALGDTYRVFVHATRRYHRANQRVNGLHAAVAADGDPPVATVENQHTFDAAKIAANVKFNSAPLVEDDR